MSNSKRRVFFLTDVEYPRGGASANYIQYLAMATKEAGYVPIIIARINSEFADEFCDGAYQGIKVFGLVLSNNKVIRHVQMQNGISKQKQEYLFQEKVSDNDIVYLSGANQAVFNCCLRLRKKLHFKLACGVLELFEFKDFQGRSKRRNYKKYWNACSSLAPKFDMVFPISTFIQNFYSEKGVSTFIIPPLTENRVPSPKSELPYKFVLPANGKMKDNLESMIRAFVELTKEELEGVELHLCGVKEEKIRGILSNAEWERLSPIITIHKWMKYDELEKLYEEMHYLLLARDVCQMNVANFPSKVPETMAYGIVPIASRVGDYTTFYLKDKKNSFILEGSEIFQIMRAIRNAISLSKAEYERMSEAARMCVAESFDYRAFSVKLKLTLDSLFT